MSNVNWEAVAKEQMEILWSQKDNFTWQAQALHDRIQALEEVLKWYVEEDEINQGDPENQYWIDGKHKAMKLLGMEGV